MITYRLNENLSNIFGVVVRNIPELSDQSLKEQVHKFDKINQDYIQEPWNKGLKGLKGTPHTEETKKQMSISKTRENHWKFGTHESEETKIKGGETIVIGFLGIM